MSSTWVSGFPMLTAQLMFRIELCEAPGMESDQTCQLILNAELPASRTSSCREHLCHRVQSDQYQVHLGGIRILGSINVAAEYSTILERHSDTFLKDIRVSVSVDDPNIGRCSHLDRGITKEFCAAQVDEKV
jgi:hypothetical protein